MNILCVLILSAFCFTLSAIVIISIVDNKIAEHKEWTATKLVALAEKVDKLTPSPLHMCMDALGRAKFKDIYPYVEEEKES